MREIVENFSLVSFLRKFDDSPFFFRLLVNLYPPFICAGVRIVSVSKDFRRIEVKMGLKWYNKNYVGTQFGGSLYAMTDPFLMIMLMKNLGPDYIVWDKAAEVEFVKPGKSEVRAVFEIDDRILDEIKRKVEEKDKYLPAFDVDVRDVNGEVIARVKKIIYVRKK